MKGCLKNLFLESEKFLALEEIQVYPLVCSAVLVLFL